VQLQLQVYQALIGFSGWEDPIMVEQILTIFRQVRDPRDFTARHDLGEMLFLVVCGLLCGEKTSVDIADFAAGHETEFREVLELRHGPPSHDTISRVLRLLDPHELERAVRACLAAMGRHLRRGAVLAVDGKALRGAYEVGHRHMPPLMVSVFDGLTRLSLAQTRAGHGGEAAAARTLLKSLRPKGCTVTADALHCRADTATVIREMGADYVLGIKSNQPTLYASAEAAFAKEPDDLPPLTGSKHQHGRHEQRAASVMLAPAAARAKLPGLVAFGRIVRERQVDGRPAQRWTHYYALSRRLTPEQLATLVRGHWGIENHLHWPLDVIFDEDASRSRKNFAPENWAVLRTIARNILEADPENIPIRKKMKKASWSKDALFNLFAHVQ
jgi:predicted transposase YbfD/YdcC